MARSGDAVLGEGRKGGAAQPRGRSALRRGLVVAVAAALAAVALSATAGDWLAHLDGPAPGARSLVPPGSTVRSFAWLGSEALRAPGPGAHLVLVETTLEEGVLERVAGFARDGGSVWILGTSPGPAPSEDGPTWILPGAIVADGGEPRHVLEGREKIDVTGTRAIVDSGSCRPLARADASTYRDANGDGRVSVGEPSGPFTVACIGDVGLGTVAVLAVPSGREVPADLVEALGDRRAPGEWRIVDDTARPAWDKAGALVAQAGSAASLGGLRATAILGACIAAGAVAILGPALASRIRSLVAHRRSSKQELETHV